MSTRRTLAPCLLLAAPRLGDPNFDHTVVLLARHDEKGALGWIVNGEALGRVGELLRSSNLVDAGSKLPDGGPFARDARRGGPVQAHTGWLLYRREAVALAGEIDVGPSLGVTGNLDALAAVVRAGTRDFRLLLGYAGWSPSQLEDEIAEGAWLPADVDVDLVFDGDPASLWKHAYEQVAGFDPGAFTSTRGGSA
jgi:putative transcriptional regulator